MPEDIRASRIVKTNNVRTRAQPKANPIGNYPSKMPRP